MQHVVPIVVLALSLAVQPRVATEAFDHAVETLERAAALNPSDASAHHPVATFYVEKSGDPRVRAPEKQ